MNAFWPWDDDSAGRQRTIQAFVRARAYRWNPKTLDELGLSDDRDLRDLIEEGEVCRVEDGSGRIYLTSVSRMTAAPEWVRRFVFVASIGLILVVVTLWLLGLPQG
ncbi:MAG: hypothetical protein U9Q74_01955 [Gemmatimonadota bacterium]|nr:hypothetical protein [Gemmatimonadota bacterium]